MDGSKILAALDGARLITGHYVDDVTGCRCAVGELGHKAGVPDDVLRLADSIITDGDDDAIAVDDQVSIDIGKAAYAELLAALASTYGMTEDQANAITILNDIGAFDGMTPSQRGPYVRDLIRDKIEAGELEASVL
jgi:hypothetical protein